MRVFYGYVHSEEKVPVLANLRGSTRRVSESFYPINNYRARKYVMLLSNFGDEHRGLSPVSDAGFRHQLVLIPPTAFVSNHFSGVSNVNFPSDNFRR